MGSSEDRAFYFFCLNRLGKNLLHKLLVDQDGLDKGSLPTGLDELVGFTLDRFEGRRSELVAFARLGFKSGFKQRIDIYEMNGDEEEIKARLSQLVANRGLGSFQLLENSSGASSEFSVFGRLGIDSDFEVEDSGRRLEQRTIYVPGLIATHGGFLVLRAVAVAPKDWAKYLGEEIIARSRIVPNRVFSDLGKLVFNGGADCNSEPYDYTVRAQHFIQTGSVETFKGKIVVDGDENPNSVFEGYETIGGTSGRISLNKDCIEGLSRLIEAEIVAKLECVTTGDTHGIPGGNDVILLPQSGSLSFRRRIEGGDIDGFINFICS